jgi:NACalpha-BTF3-like transcription factor
VILAGGAGGAPATSVRAREDRERELARQRADPFADVARDLFIGGGNNKIITDEKGGFVKKLIKEDDIVAFPKAGQMIDKLANFYNDTITTVNSIANKIGSVKINESAFNVEELIRKQKSFVETISSKQKTETAEKTVKEEQKITFDDIKLTVDVKGMTPELNKIFQDKNVVNEFKNMIIGEIAKQGQRVNKKGFFGSK